MSEGTALVKINLDAFALPANTLIEKISSAAGILYEPHQIKRIAKAQSEAERIKTLSNITNKEIERRALQRFISEETERQKNMEEIIELSLPQIKENAEPEKIENDWIKNFFDKCRLISDKEMQSLWARILAGEASAPGSFSKRTINFIASLDKNDAVLFTKLCSFNWLTESGIKTPFIYNLDDEIYLANGINFPILNHLSNIGLINVENLTNFSINRLSKKTFLTYGEIKIEIEPKSREGEGTLNIGRVILTSIGLELANICLPESILNYVNFLTNKWINESLKPACPVKVQLK